MPDLTRDIRFSLRSLLRGGPPVAISLLTLVAGLVGTTAIYSVARSVLTAPLPADEPERVVRLSRWTPENPDLAIPIPTFFDWRERNRSLAALGGFTDGLGFTLEGSPPLRVQAAAVTSGFFEALGRAPSLGRAFGDEADEPGGARQVLISQRLWIDRFGASTDVVGRSLRLDGEPWEVVGVLPPAFDFPRRGTDLWIPLGSMYREVAWENRSVSSLVAVARLQDGVDAEQARLDLERVTQTIADDTGVTPQPRPRVVPLDEALLGELKKTLWILGGVAGLVLLLAVANVAGLLLARGFRRRGEIAVRLALGAKRRSVARLLLLESSLLALLAGVLALASTPLAADLLLRWLPTASLTPGSPTLTADLLAFGLVLALLGGAACGLVPAWRSSRQDPAGALRESAARVVGGRRLQSALVLAEIAAACVLLVTTGLMVRSLGSLLAVDTGIRSDGLLVQRFDPNVNRYPSVQQWIDLNVTVAEAAEREPDVERAAVALSAPLDGNAFLGRVATPDLPLRPDVLPLCQSMTVSETFLEVVGLRPVAGRGFTEQDDLASPLVVVVDEGLAEHFWPGENPLGRRIALEVRFPTGGYRPGAEVEPIWREVVGVVPSIRMDDLRRPPRLQAYMPLRQLPIHFQGDPPSPYLLTRTRGVPLDASESLRAALQRVDPSMPVSAGRTVEGILDDLVAQERLLSWLLGSLTLLAVVLAAAGIYSIQAQSTAQRTREVGLRLALGATPGDLLRRITWQGARLALAGLAVGLGASFFASRLVESRLFGVGRFDLATWLLASVVLLGAAVCASLLPAWRASRTHPAEALRYE